MEASSRHKVAEIDEATASVVPGAMTVVRPLTRLAVLPFRLLRPDPEIESLAFALADAVSTSLSCLPSVVIRPSAAVARFATEAPDLKAVAREETWDLALVGTLLRARDQLRATVQILEAPGGTLVSSQPLQSGSGTRSACRASSASGSSNRFPRPWPAARGNAAGAVGPVYFHRAAALCC
jgi:TolB-like protein